MPPLFSIITPTVQRESLLKTCQSLDEQRFQDWEHIVIIDSIERNSALVAQIEHPRRTILQCPTPHRNGGNTCRHLAWEYATGTLCYFLDDDNYLASPAVLEGVAEEAMKPVFHSYWMLFPILRHGSIFYFDPPKPCYFDTGNAVVRREIGCWPDIPDYASDAVWLEQLLNYRYVGYPGAQPIMVMPTTSFGAGGGINGQ